MNLLSRRNFLHSSFWLFAGLVLGRASTVPEGVASHPPEYDRAPVPDLAGEITTEDCLTRDQIERVTEMALERACPVELSAEADLRLKMAARSMNPPVIWRGAPVLPDVNMSPGEIVVLNGPQFIEAWAQEQAHAANSSD